MTKDYREVMTFAQLYNQMVKWFVDFPKFKQNNKEVVLDGDVDAGRVKANIYTATNHYSIVGTTTGYLGCVASTRTPRAGEDWTRGNDLPDGLFNQETYVEILQAIVAYESVKIHKKEKVND